MKVTNFFLLATASCTLLLAACGGGGGNEPTPSEPQASSTYIESIAGQRQALTRSSALRLQVDCYLSTADFVQRAGRIQTGSTCGEFSGFTNSAASDYSIGQFEFNQAVSTNLSVSATIRKTRGNLSRPTELYFRGGAVGWAFTGSTAFYFIYESESHWTGWLETTLLNHDSENDVQVIQNGKLIKVVFNGSLVDEFELQAEPSNGKVAVFFKGDPGTEEQMSFRNFTVLDYSSDELSAPDFNTSVLGDLARIHGADVLATDFVLDIGSNDSSSNISIRRLTVTNTGTASTPSPRVIPSAGSQLQQFEFANPRACTQLDSLLPGATCYVYLSTATDSLAAGQGEGTKRATALAATSTARQTAAITSGGSFIPFSTTFSLTQSSFRPRLTGISPNVLLVNRRTLITVHGQNLPASLALSFSGSNCENSTKPAPNQIYCTPRSSLPLKGDVMDSSTGKRIGTLALKVVPAPFADPLAGSYMNRYQRGFAQPIAGVGVHTGWDLMTDGLNPAVSAVAGGTVVENLIDLPKYKDEYSKYWNAFLVIQHSGFCGYYGHLDNSARLRKGATVSAGQFLGNVRDAYPDMSKPSSVNKAWNHLHLSFSTKGACQTSKIGYRPTEPNVRSVFSDPSGFVYLR